MSDDLVEPMIQPSPPEPPRKFSPWLKEAANHARLRVFPGSLIGELVYEELEWASRHEWSNAGRAVALATEVYRLQESGFVLNGRDDV